VIEVLAGLDNVDKLITELVNGLDRLIRAGSACQLPNTIFKRSFMLIKHSRTSKEGDCNCSILDLEHVSDWAGDLSHSSRSLSRNRQGKSRFISLLLPLTRVCSTSTKTMHTPSHHSFYLDFSQTTISSNFRTLIKTDWKTLSMKRR
jgi:hypothetical protein